MRQVIYSPYLEEDLTRIVDFMDRVSPETTPKLVNKIINSFSQLIDFPKLGALSPQFPELRRLVIHFGHSSYVALYHFDELNNMIEIMGIKHSRELSFSFEHYAR
ncbi:type II toxin-antitoxin system RelE/ParE family toxin [Wielerella bovis]|uniref:type II toxin-antitoxin system RelE/ParE family toxin n=1 Tax=Wielerella bovis TaxID=2917790 RepID=UPI0020189A58|nr:type II toxin-antitoxin system RelE/ParE family toxin [Wielerella bovis]ULJ59386.1 type II toxin-antitoxin system RelE/ParE family toxin [Wielerella bovis]ULJ60056.1 type II toxin-antitoxin system RelE/ParE family toxin [Wielerella bovis]ULJ61601.1 type II toxin-antitoxin system RelE/ParE family toxin [Wielerella bovis]ULJ62257.1 type II toxin-antitoxin system RelE/ParE family toxin [Wielerella bovis]ULJ63717.1 type II toxin-antitoxin system RelE/ParE family toxin [Wielerella bovis]